jgi:hypothetical protein
MSDQVIFTKEEVEKIRRAIWDGKTCTFAINDYLGEGKLDDALALLDSPRPRPKVSLIMLDSIVSSCYRIHGEGLTKYKTRLAQFVDRYGFDVED